MRPSFPPVALLLLAQSASRERLRHLLIWTGLRRNPPHALRMPVKPRSDAKPYQMERDDATNHGATASPLA